MVILLLLLLWRRVEELRGGVLRPRRLWCCSCALAAHGEQRVARRTNKAFVVVHSVLGEQLTLVMLHHEGVEAVVPHCKAASYTCTTATA